MLDQIGRKEIQLVVLVVVLAAGIACNTFMPASGPTQPEDSTQAPQATVTPRIRPTLPPTWTPTWPPTRTPTSPPVSPTPTVEPTATISLSLSFPTSAPILVSPSPDTEFSPPDFGDWAEGFGMSCEPSEDVLIEAAGDCSSVNTICSTSVDIFGIVMSLSVYYEIVGEEEEQCALYVRMEDVSISFTEEFIQLALLDEDLTREDVLQMEDEMNAEASRAEGRDGVCKFDSTEELVAFLTVMKGDDGSFGASCNIVDGEWICGEEGGASTCEGDLFEGTAE